jgi:hypothetical protein
LLLGRLEFGKLLLTHGAWRDGRFTDARSDQVFVDGQDFFGDRTLIELLLDVAEGVRVVPSLTAEQATSVIQVKAFTPVRPLRHDAPFSPVSVSVIRVLEV